MERAREREKYRNGVRSTPFLSLYLFYLRSPVCMSLTDIHTFTPPSLGFSNAVSQPVNQSITEAASKQPPVRWPANKHKPASQPASQPTNERREQPASA